jgi:hypothetical protein
MANTKLTVVLDTNAFRGLQVAEIERIASLGFKFSVSEMAISETMAASVREYRAGLARDRARGKLFKRVKAFAPYIDSARPIAVVGAHAINRVRLATGLTVDEAVLSGHDTYLLDLWRTMRGIELTDEEWLQNGDIAERWLAALDAELSSLARPFSDLWSNVKDDVDTKRADWNAASDETKLTAIHTHIVQAWGLDDATANRLDAFVRFFAWRLLRARESLRTDQRKRCDRLALPRSSGRGVSPSERRQGVRTPCG